ncbi:MAG: N-acetylglucosamine-6-phosphate deacetylase [Lachnospiraceae bacterium]|nr:N-acetylglucosamine-6-phosphate deacetylase [Lachnospiraceae bacterium]
MRQIKGIVYTEWFRFEAGVVTVDGGSITSVELCGEAELTEEQRGQYILPGLIDIHFHGCAGYDFCDGTTNAMRAIASYELSHGVTSICPATMTLQEETLAGICAVCADAVNAETLSHGIPLGDVLRGIYLEGPFISEEKRGAQNPAYIRKPDSEMLMRLQHAAKGLIRIVAIAPETEGALECIRSGRKDFRFSIAHTCADYETAKKAIGAGACNVTHLFNAMPPFAHREPGVVGAAAESEGVTAELICDGYHIHPGMVRSAFRLFGADRIVLISDSMMAAGMEDGEYALGGQPVRMRGGLATLADGTLAGSAVNLFDCMKTAILMGVPTEDAVRAATYNPAAAIGIDGECGSLRAGSRADILVTDREFGLREVIKSGITAVNQ